MTKQPTPFTDRAAAYANGVASGKILACRWVRLACQRFIDDRKKEKDPSYPYKFEPALVERFCKFAELFPHVKGHWAIPKPGDPTAHLIRLQDWECFLFANVYGWLERATNFRRFGTAYLEVPRKNGKSVKAAIAGLYGLAAEGEWGAEVYSGATSEKQAWEVFRPAKLMADQTPAYREAYGVQVNAKGIVIAANGSRFEPIIGKPGDGASPSLAIVDEYHEHPDSTLYDTMVTGMGARQQPLMFVITTAGSDTAGPCYALHEQVERMLDGSRPNDRLFGLLYSIDPEIDWTSETALRMANPNFDVSVSGKYLREQQAEAVASARQQNVFKTKHLDIWVTVRDAWMNLEWWNRQADTSLRAEQFVNVPCYAGADLASKLDIAAVVRVFRRMEGEGEDAKPHYYVFGRYYLPSGTVEDPKNRHYQGWAHDGYLTVLDGDTNNFGAIRRELYDDVAAHGLEQLALDPWGGHETEQEATGKGITTLMVDQTTKNFSDAMKSIEALTKSGQLHHDGNPCLTWMISNVTVREDANENIYPRKEGKERKIDGATALIMAMGRALLAEEGRSVYEDEDLFTL